MGWESPGAVKFDLGPLIQSQTRIASAVRRPTWFPDILGNSSYPSLTTFGTQVYWINSLYGIAFGDDSCIAN